MSEKARARGARLSFTGGIYVQVVPVAMARRDVEVALYERDGPGGGDLTDAEVEDLVACLRLGCRTFNRLVREREADEGRTL